MSAIKRTIRAICPPFLWAMISGIVKNNTAEVPAKPTLAQVSDPQKQDLDVYWNLQMAEVLDNWGRDHVWNEIQMFLANSKGKVLDIACGTGVTINIVAANANLEVHGCDISDLFIKKALNRGIEKSHLKVCDATNMDCYPDNSFDYSYSIGSLEHFTDSGILKFIEEVYRITGNCSYHMVPISKNGENNGWIKKVQSYYNNSEEWWIEKFKSKYKDVRSFNSCWKDGISNGMWFVCKKN